MVAGENAELRWHGAERGLVLADIPPSSVQIAVQVSRGLRTGMMMSKLVPVVALLAAIAGCASERLTVIASQGPQVDLVRMQVNSTVGLHTQYTMPDTEKALAVTRGMRHSLKS